jgi:hypothetical protein
MFTEIGATNAFAFDYRQLVPVLECLLPQHIFNLENIKVLFNRS